MNVLFPFLNFSKTYVNLIFVVDSDFIGVTSVCSRIDTNVKCYVLVLHFAFLQGLLKSHRFSPCADQKSRFCRYLPGSLHIFVACFWGQSYQRTIFCLFNFIKKCAFCTFIKKNIC